jgi:Cu+-exporting ATPase
MEAGQALLHLKDSQESCKTAKFLESVGGILRVSRNGDCLTVTYDPSQIGSRAIMQTQKLAGHSAVWDPSGASNEGVAEANRNMASLQKDLYTALFLTGWIVVLCWVVPCFEHCEPFLKHEIVPGLRTMTVLMCLLATPVMLLSGRRFHVAAFHSIKSGIWDMNVLISLGTGLAYVYSVIVVIFASVLHGSWISIIVSLPLHLTSRLLAW